MGGVDLVATSPPYATAIKGIDKPAWLAGGSLGVSDSRDYSRDHANAGRLRDEAYRETMRQVYAGCYALLRPSGIVAVTVRPFRQHGELVDLPAAVLAAGERAGLVPFERLVALLAGLRDDHLVPRNSFFHLYEARKARARGEPRHLTAHEDMLILRKPTEQEQASSGDGDDDATVILPHSSPTQGPDNEEPGDAAA